MNPSRQAVFFVYVWPEPRSSAAGVRTRELMRVLLAQHWRVTAVSPSGQSAHRKELDDLGISTLSCDPNSSPATESALRSLSPSLVIYDRFVMEEQFGWRARALWPEALHVVDTQDLHSVRRARERLAEAGAPREKIMAPPESELGEDFLRELASLYRADLSLVVSSWERDFLGRLGFPADRLHCLPLPGERDLAPPPFAARSGFCFLGNFRHPPNLDAARWILREIWPLIRERRANAELHLYGAYPPAEISRHQGKQGIFAHGPVMDHRAALAKHRALLAPLRFGAGIKGKVLEAWGTGTPVIGTPLTFEGMGDCPLATAADVDAIAALALALHGEESTWHEALREGQNHLDQSFSRDALAKNFLRILREGFENLSGIRRQNRVGRMLQHQQNNATKYFSRWIEAKNQLR